MTGQGRRVAVLIPCLNEEIAIADVVRRSLVTLPDAQVYVYDNGSTDGTVSVASAAGAIVRSETKRGKGNVVRRMFADIEADVYVMIDGDGTYEIEAAPRMIEMLLSNRLDMVTGNREEDGSSEATYRKGHRLGNRLFTGSLKKIFKSDCDDVLSGYRVMSRRFVKSFPTVSRGFEIEVEMTAHASVLRAPTGEYPTRYVERPANSFSKLNTYRDGMRIARSLLNIFRSYSPSRFFGSLALVALASSVPFFARARFSENADFTNSVLPALILVLLFALILMVGIILNAMSRQRVEMLRLAYLSIAASDES